MESNFIEEAVQNADTKSVGSPTKEQEESKDERKTRAVKKARAASKNTKNKLVRGRLGEEKKAKPKETPKKSRARGERQTFDGRGSGAD